MRADVLKIVFYIPPPAKKATCTKRAFNVRHRSVAELSIFHIMDKITL